jgi:hypothetical protein
LKLLVNAANFPTPSWNRQIEAKPSQPWVLVYTAPCQPEPVGASWGLEDVVLKFNMKFDQF